MNWRLREAQRAAVQQVLTSPPPGRDPVDAILDALADLHLTEAQQGLPLRATDATITLSQTFPVDDTLIRNQTGRVVGIDLGTRPELRVVDIHATGPGGNSIRIRFAVSDWVWVRL